MVELLTIGSFVFLTGSVYMVAHMLIRVQQDPVRRRLATASRQPIGWTDIHTPDRGMAGNLPNKVDESEIDKDLRRAGFYKPNARDEFNAMRYTLATLVIIATGVIAVILVGDDMLVMQSLGIGLVLTVFFWALPVIFLSFQAKARVGRIRRALPDSLDLISMCMAGGLTFEDSLTRVSHDMFVAHPDLAVELIIIRYQADMNSLEFAFTQFAHRVDGPEVIALKSLIAQSQRLGTNVCASVRQFADELRLERRQLADAKSAKAEFWLLIPVVFLLLPSTVIFMWLPAVVQLITHFATGGAENFMTP